MKPFNYNQNPYWIKLGLSGAMLIALGTSLSFNQESKTLARNESSTSGEFSFASTKEKKLAPIELSGKCKGVTANAIQVDNIDANGNKKSTLVFQYAKSSTAADVCESCVAAIGPKEVPFKSENGISPETPMAFSILAEKLASDAIDECSSFSRSEAKASHKDEADDEILYDTKCDAPKEIDDVPDTGSCQRSELSDLAEKCVSDAKDQYRHDVDKAHKEKKSASGIKNNMKNCSRLVKQYFENEMRPMIQMGLQEPAGTPAHDDAVRTISFITSGAITDPDTSDLTKLPPNVISPALAKTADDLLRRGDIQSANKFYNSQIMQQQAMCQRQFGYDPNTCKVDEAAKLARLKTQTYINTIKMSEGSMLGYNSSNLDDFMQTTEYSLSFQNAYNAPMSSLLGALNNQKQNVDLATLLNQYLNGAAYSPDSAVGAPVPGPLAPGTSGAVNQGNQNTGAFVRNSGRNATNLPVFQGNTSPRNVGTPGINPGSIPTNGGGYPVTPGMSNGGVQPQPVPQYPQQGYPQQQQPLPQYNPQMGYPQTNRTW